MTQLDPPFFLIALDGRGTGMPRRCCPPPYGRILAKPQGFARMSGTDCAAANRQTSCRHRSSCAARVWTCPICPAPWRILGFAGKQGRIGPARAGPVLPFAKSVVTEDTTTHPRRCRGCARDCLSDRHAWHTALLWAVRTAGVQTCIGGWGYQVSDQAFSGEWLGHGVLNRR